MQPASRRSGTSTSTALRTLAVIVLTPLMCLTGCMSSQPTGNLVASSRAENPVKLSLDLKYGAFAKQPAQHSFFLSSVPLEGLLDAEIENAIVLHAQLLWQPKPGARPSPAPEPPVGCLCVPFKSLRRMKEGVSYLSVGIGP